MLDEKNLCMSCMKEMLPKETVCPDCGYDSNTPQDSPYLPKGAVIRNRYLVGAVKSEAPDSITYAGMDTESGESVTITEFYPSNIVSRPMGSDGVAIMLGYEEIFRDYLQSFLSLWRGLMSLNGTACLPQVIEVVDYNSTVYAISHYKDCISLRSFFERKKTPLTWKKAQSAFRPIIAALALLHGKGIWHGSISPDFICVGADGKLHLTGFSIPECHDADSYTPAEPVSGFSPLEYYGDAPAIGSYSDVYSVIAVIYYAITGIIPDASTNRAENDSMVMPSEIAKTMSRHDLGVFVKGLALRRNNRISSAQALYDGLYTIAPTSSTATQRAAAGTKKETPKRTPPTPKRVTTKKATQEDGSVVPLMLKTFFAVLAVCILLFTLLYSTFLYKSVDIPFLDKMLSPIGFLPVNQSTDYTPDSTDGIDATASSEGSTTPYETFYVTVPDLSEETYESIQSNEVYNRDFNIIFKFESNKNYTKNAVISQSLPKGESVPSGSDLTVVISSGIVQIELKDVSGMDYQIAKEQLEHLGFKVKKELTENDGTETAGEVYMMSKVAGLEFDEGTEIVLFVWDEVKETTTKATTTKATTTKKETTSAKSGE